MILRTYGAGLFHQPSSRELGALELNRRRRGRERTRIHHAAAVDQTRAVLHGGKLRTVGKIDILRLAAVHLLREVQSVVGHRSDSAAAVRDEVAVGVISDVLLRKDNYE